MSTIPALSPWRRRISKAWSGGPEPYRRPHAGARNVQPHRRESGYPEQQTRVVRKAEILGGQADAGPVDGAVAVLVVIDAEPVDSRRRKMDADPRRRRPGGHPDDVERAPLGEEPARIVAVDGDRDQAP